MNPSLPRTPRDVLKFSSKDRMIFNWGIAFFKFTGLWRFPKKASGDIESMSLLDKLYWVYKTTHPIRKSKLGKKLEQEWKRKRSFHWNRPNDFTASQEITLTAVGDLINHAYLGNSANVLYSQVAPLIFDADVSMANLECVLTDQARNFEFSPKAGPPLSYDERNFNAVKGHQSKQYTFMATACNHSLDFGPEGVQSTIKNLKRCGICFHGLNESAEDFHRATILESNGIKLGIISHTFGLNGYVAPVDQPWIVNRTNLNEDSHQLQLDQILRQIQYCREHQVDFIIAQLHWGMEHEFYPRPEQVRVARLLAETGIDAIIGHHPHVVQPVEFYQTKRDPHRVVPVYYSLGNLVNAFSADYLCLSYIAQLSLVKGRFADGASQTYVQSASRKSVVQTAHHESKTLRLSTQED